MPRLTLKDLVEEYNAPKAITVNYWRVLGDCSKSGG